MFPAFRGVLNLSGKVGGATESAMKYEVWAPTGRKNAMEYGVFACLRRRLYKKVRHLGC